MTTGGTATGSRPVVRCRGHPHFPVLLGCAGRPTGQALFSRLHQRGEVVDRSLDLVYTCFAVRGR
jgi:hypothetical protein